MKYGVNALIWTASFELEHLPLLPRVKERGFTGIEIPIFDPGSTPTAEIRRGLEDNGLEVTTCAVMPNGLTVFAESAGIRQQALDHIKLSIETTAKLGGHLVAGPTYSPVGYLPGRRRTADEFQQAAESLRALGDTLRAHDVKLAIEPLNRFETFFLNTAADAAALCDNIDDANIGILFDTFHANIEEKSLGDGLRICGKHLFHVHTCENDRGTPGSGHVPWVEVFDTLRAMRYDNWLTIESFGYNIPEIAAAAAIWRDIAPLPESIGFDGLTFLKRMTA